MAAIDRYRLELRRRSPLRRLPQLVVAAVSRGGAAASGPIWPVTALLIDRTDGAVVGEIRNTDRDPHDVIGAAHTDLVWLGEDEFEQRWLPERHAARALR